MKAISTAFKIDSLPYSTPRFLFCRIFKIFSFSQKNRKKPSK